MRRHHTVPTREGYGQTFDDVRRMLGLSMGGLACLAVAFGLGLMVGKRSVVVDAGDHASEAVPQDRIAQLEAQKTRHEQLQFFEHLSAVSPSNSIAVASPQPAAPARVAVSKPVSKPEGVESAGVRVQQIRREPTSTASAEGTSVARPPGLDAGPARHGDYTVQVSAFKSFAEADAFAAGLQRKGFKPFIVTSHIPSKGTWYRVRIGRFMSSADASSAKMTLAQADIPAWVLRTE